MYNLIFILLLIYSPLLAHRYKYDLTIVGHPQFANSLARTVIAQTECLKDHLRINNINTNISQTSFYNVSPKAIEIFINKDKSPGAVAILDAMLGNYRFMPRSPIKLAYTMIESTAIPKSWTHILNNHFDAAIVPDQYYVNVYKNSGVKIPIFVLPLILYLEEFLTLKPKEKPSQPFTFGISGTFALNKNISLMLEAFHKAFANTSNVILKIHTHWNYRIDEVKNKIKELNLQNVELHVGELSWPDYIKFISSLDCYILLSRGEGFSITPREALAAGVPCIITNNTAHKTICDTGLVRSVASVIEKKHEGEFYGESCGVNFMCTVDDAVAAMLDVYQNYPIYQQKAHLGRQWVQQYLSHNLRQQYLTLFKPKKVVLSDKNLITNDTLYTNSQRLYKKYLAIIK